MNNHDTQQSASNHPEPRSKHSSVTSGQNNSATNADKSIKQPLVDEFGNPLYREHDEFGEWLSRNQSEEHHHPYGS